MKKKHDKGKVEDVNYLELMFAGGFYNEKRIPGYNHLLGTLEGKPLFPKYEIEMPSIGTLK